MPFGYQAADAVTMPPGDYANPIPTTSATGPGLQLSLS